MGATSSCSLDCLLLFTLRSDLTVGSGVAGDATVFKKFALFLPLGGVDRDGAAAGAGGVLAAGLGAGRGSDGSFGTADLKRFDTAGVDPAASSSDSRSLCTAGSW